MVTELTQNSMHWSILKYYIDEMIKLELSQLPALVSF